MDIPPDVIADAVRQALADYLTTRSLFDQVFIDKLAMALVDAQAMRNLADSVWNVPAVNVNSIFGGVLTSVSAKTNGLPEGK